jgi:hypothetical protein
MDHLTIGQDDLQPGDVVRGEPVLEACAPPEFSATLPPIEHTIGLDGSGG